MGTSYTNDNTGKEMIHYIAETRRQDLAEKLNDPKFLLTHGGKPKSEDHHRKREKTIKNGISQLKSKSPRVSLKISFKIGTT